MHSNFKSCNHIFSLLIHSPFIDQIRPVWDAPLWSEWLVEEAQRSNPEFWVASQSNYGIFSFFGSSSMNSLKTNSDVGGQKGRDLSMFTFVRSCPPIVRSYPPTVRSCTPQNCNFAWTLACPWRHCWKATASSSDLYYRATPITHF